MSLPRLDFIPPVIAHRGARIRAPENTIASFRAAREDGALWIETDIKLTSDGTPILMHDNLLDRTTNGRGDVAAMAWKDMQNLDAGAWFSPSFKNTRIPTLAQLLAFARESGTRLNLELKPCPGRTQATVMVALIEAAKLWPESAPVPLISSFDVEALSLAAQLHPGWPRGLLLDQWRNDWPVLAAKTQASMVTISDEIATPEHIAVLNAARMSVLVYTVNDPARAKSLLNGGVQAVFSDNPAEILRSL
jgi:glycerophosphoryl diester phosphodiesterase